MSESEDHVHYTFEWSAEQGVRRRILLKFNGGNHDGYQIYVDTDPYDHVCEVTPRIRLCERVQYDHVNSAYIHANDHGCYERITNPWESEVEYRWNGYEWWHKYKAENWRV